MFQGLVSHALHFFVYSWLRIYYVQGRVGQLPSSPFWCAVHCPTYRWLGSIWLMTSSMTTDGGVCCALYTRTVVSYLWNHAASSGTAGVERRSNFKFHCFTNFSAKWKKRILQPATSAKRVTKKMVHHENMHPLRSGDTYYSTEIRSIFFKRNPRLRDIVGKRFLEIAKKVNQEIGSKPVHWLNYLAFEAIATIRFMKRIEVFERSTREYKRHFEIQ